MISGCAREFCPDCGQSFCAPNEKESFGCRRTRALDEIVRRALLGIDWRNSCETAMVENGISFEEVEAQIRKASL